MQDITFSSVASLSRALQAREVSAVELAEHYLGRIEAHRGLNAFLDVRPEATLEEARAARQNATGELAIAKIEAEMAALAAELQAIKKIRQQTR
mgnify:CR=1 FL=1